MTPITDIRAPSRLRRAGTVGILGALSAFGPLSVDMYLPAFPSMAADLHASASAVQLTLTTCLAGLAVGQLIAGPVSDSLGRRRPLLVGLAVFAVLSLVCALSPSVYALVGLRFVQALGAAVGLVIANAAVRDRYAGAAMARFLSMLMLVVGVAPIVAPVLGGQLLRLVSWRGVFVVLALVGLVLLIVCALWFEESLPPADRRAGSLPGTLRSYRELLADRMFLGYALAGGLGFGAMFAYIADSPFVLQDVFGLSPQLFSLVFAMNAAGIVVVSQVNGRLVGRLGAHRLLAGGLVAAAVGGAVLLVGVLAGFGLPVILPALFAVVASVGVVLPNTRALAMTEYPRAAGTASALLGVLQFLFGGVVAPLIGLGGTHTAVPMAAVIAALPIAGLIVFLTLTRTAVADR